MKFVVVALLLVSVASVYAQIKICENIKPGQVPSSNVRQKGSVPSGQYADLTLEWNRPKDRTTANGVDSCIDTYNVQIIRARDNKVLQQSSVSVTPPHTTASYTAKGLSAGDTYKFAIQAKGPGGEGPKNGPFGSFTTAKQSGVMPL